MQPSVFVVAFVSALCAASGLAFDRAVPHQMARLYMDMHVSAHLQSTLNLTPAQLKIYAGHALNMLMARCNTVDQDKLQHFHKYISKLIAHNNGKQIMLHATAAPASNSDHFLALVNSLKTCSKRPPLPVTPNVPAPRASGSSLPPAFGAATSNDDQQQEEVLLELPNAAESERGTTRARLITVPTAKHEKPHKALHSEDSSIESFFQRIFGSMGSFFTQVLPSVFARGRRATEAKERREHSAVSNAEKGKEAIVQFVDEVCRLYCSSCSGASSYFPAHHEVIAFKMAAKELRDYLTSDESFSTMASLILDDQLMTQVKSCGRRAAPSAFPVFQSNQGPFVFVVSKKLPLP